MYKKVGRLRVRAGRMIKTGITRKQGLKKTGVQKHASRLDETRRISKRQTENTGINAQGIMGYRVVQRSKALYLSARGVSIVPSIVPSLNPGCVTSGRDWEFHNVAHNWPNGVWVWPE
jgi:hypothetical protein